ncbi:MAG: orotidine-5'-phosphate decarboxylase [Candidatus Muirbacterium halophilum]|nr:orotidine-5'-phosphate decarboxylase [Candidatus Muirbacterium halophilum]MCK9475081.1 orotidine-5'-phosphate decarboxylase [Candidatus Muirbacterium halophilum]
MAKLFVALDFDNEEKALEICQKSKNYIDGYKIGLELFCSCGKDIVNKVAEFGEVFLDLKFHDIPNTVIKTIESIAKLPVSIINLHALCGSYTMGIVKDSIKGINPNCKVIGVTMLTSVDNNILKSLNFNSCNVGEQVDILAELVYNSGLDGIVCSPQEVIKVKKKFGNDFLTIVPGIRQNTNEKDDQKRVATPKEAVKNGADILICGRPIYNAKDIKQVILDIKNEMGDIYAR